MLSRSLINQNWAHTRPWNRLDDETSEMLNAFIGFMRDPKNFKSGTALSEFSVLQYFTRVRRAVFDGGDMISALDRPGKKAAKATVRQAIAVWAAFVGDMEGQRIMDKIRMQKQLAKEQGPRGGIAPREDRLALSEDDWMRLRLRAEQDHDAKAVVVQLLARSSLRIGDALRITRMAIHIGMGTGELKVVLKERHTVRFPVAPIRAQLDQLLRFRNWDTVQDLLGGTYYSATKRVRRRLEYYAVELGIPDVYPHRLRHTVLTALAHGTGPATAQALAGHASPETTARYTRRPPSTKALGDAMLRVLGEARDAG